MEAINHYLDCIFEPSLTNLLYAVQHDIFICVKYLIDNYIFDDADECYQIFACACRYDKSRIVELIFSERLFTPDQALQRACKKWNCDRD
jgi:hypothetical protein